MWVKIAHVRHASSDQQRITAESLLRLVATVTCRTMEKGGARLAAWHEQARKTGSRFLVTLAGGVALPGALTLYLEILVNKSEPFASN
jgi:hypothetical protein